MGSALEQYLKLDLNKWLKVLRHLELLPRPLGQDWSEIWLQRFSGTITIWPKSIPSDFYHILSDPSPQRLARMIHVGQQSAFPKLKFIANRAKIEHLIQQGRRQYRSGGAKDGELAILSEDELPGDLKRIRSGGPDADLSDSSSSGPDDIALALNSLPRGAKTAPPHLKNTTAGRSKKSSGPDSPSLSQRLSGWWSALSPSDAQHPNAQIRKRTSPSPSRFHHDRPSSMFELRPSRDQITRDLLEPLPTSFTGERGSGSFMKELRRQSRVFMDDESDDGHASTFGDARQRYDTKDTEAGPDAKGIAEDYGDMFGDDEDDGELESGSAIGLGLEKGVAG